MQNILFNYLILVGSLICVTTSSTLRNTWCHEEHYPILIGDAQNATDGQDLTCMLHNPDLEHIVAGGSSSAQNVVYNQNPAYGSISTLFMFTLNNLNEVLWSKQYYKHLTNRSIMGSRMYQISDCSFQSDYKFIVVSTQNRHLLVLDATTGELTTVWDYTYPGGV